MSRREEQLTNQYLAFAKERDQLNESLEFIGQQLAKEKYPFEPKQKVLVKNINTNETTPAYFKCAVTRYYSGKYVDKPFLTVTPYLLQAKKDGTISIRSVYLSQRALDTGEIEIKPFED